MPSITIIIPVFNGSRYLPQFINSLESSISFNSEIIIIDDFSNEPIIDLLPEYIAGNKVIIIRNSQNLGYSATVNKGFSIATGDIIIQLNTDLILEKNCITALISFIQNTKKVGIVGSRLIYPTTGQLQHIGMAFGYYSKRHLYKGLPCSHPLCKKTRPMQIMTGATVAMTKSLLNNIGPLDERYFNHNEDLDHCMKAHTLGYTNYTCAESTAYHWESQSGPARFAKTKESEAIFWSNWGNKYESDLASFFNESICYLLESRPELIEYPFYPINLSRSLDDEIILQCIESFWPKTKSRTKHARAYNLSSIKIWLPMLLPYRMISEPNPFIYIVDEYQSLSENYFWFKSRSRTVVDELIVDLSGIAITTSDFLHNLDYSDDSANATITR